MPLITKSQARKLYPSVDHNLQTILFSKDLYTLKQARDWLKQHGYLYQNHRNTKNERRFVQAYDVKDAEFYAKKITDGIVFIFQKW